MIFWQFFLKIHFVVERSPTLDRSRPDRRRRSDFGGCVSEPASIPFTCRFLVLILKGWSKFSRWSASLWTRHHRIWSIPTVFPHGPRPIGARATWGRNAGGFDPVVGPKRPTDRLSELQRFAVQNQIPTRERWGSSGFSKKKCQPKTRLRNHLELSGTCFVFSESCSETIGKIR